MESQQRRSCAAVSQLVNGSRPVHIYSDRPRCPIPRQFQISARIITHELQVIKTNKNRFKYFSQLLRLLLISIIYSLIRWTRCVHLLYNLQPSRQYDHRLVGTYKHWHIFISRVLILFFLPMDFDQIILYYIIYLYLIRTTYFFL